MKKRLLALVMALVLLVPVFLVRGAAATSLPASIYLQQEGSTTCTLSSATMMLRARAYLSGNDSWSSITESAVRPKGWKEGSGLYYSFKYTFGQSSIQVSHSTTSGISVASLKSLLNSHPEGIVFYCGKLPHAVFLTDYEGDTFYCADPLSGYSGKRIPLASSWLGKKYGSQANVLKNATAYWYVSSYNIDGNSFKYPTDNYADIGTDFTAVILNKTAWKPIENCYTEGEKPAVKIAKETGYANQVWYFVRQDDGSYKISSCYDGKYLDVRDASMATCAVIQTCVDSGSDAQKWYIYEENGGYILKSKLNGYVIDLVNNDSANGTHIQTYEYNGTDAQIWAIYKGKESALSAPTLSVTTSDSKGETKFTWNEVYGESHYDVKIWKNKAWEGDAYHIQWGAKSGYSLNLPAGTYQAYVDAVNYYQCIPSNVVTFTIQEHKCTNSSVVTKPTCTEKGYTTYTCKSCGTSFKGDYTNALGHDYSYKVTTKPTTSVAGVITGTCSRCKGTTTVQLPKLNTTDYTYKVQTAATCTKDGTGNYTWKNTSYGTFSFDVVIPKTGHTYTSRVVEPSCTHEGYTKYTCSCGDTYTQNQIAALGHQWGDGTVTKEPTEEAEGQMMYLCTREGCIDFKVETIAKLEHTHKYTETVTAPTCTEKGYTTHTCACGHSYVDGETAALGHAWDDGKVTKEPTEDAEGEKVYSCTRSGCSETKTEAVPPITHIHQYTEAVVAPTCVEKGYTTHTCACGDSYTSDYIDALGHDYKSTVTDPTCTEGGYTVHTCSNCNDSYTDSNTEAIGHSWDEGKVTTEPTEETEGVKTYTCMRCGETKTDAVPKLDHTHSYTETVTAPTCTEKGYSTYTCGCGDSYTDN
ncbi:MAG: RICIN domain-containing protein, partial [Oscillospiraceae bacterium]|nr:RICIN domain-containing protein [Oscillospiraceae bacterium]